MTLTKRERIEFRAVELFYTSNKNVPEIARALRVEFPDAKIPRQTVYPWLRDAHKNGFVQLIPPLDQELRARLCKAFNLHEDNTRVVLGSPAGHGDQVANVAAQRVLELAKTLHIPGQQQVLGLGLGPGAATLEFSRYLSAMLVNDPHPMRLALFALTAGGPAHSPEQSPVSFFNLFPDRRVASRVGMFAQNLVSGEEFARTKSQPGVREAFQERGKISIVVTAMGDMQDEHDLLTEYLTDAGVDTIDLRKKGWLGNVQYRPFTESGAVVETARMPRAVTLFELDELSKLSATRDKHVLLMVRPCVKCGNTRARALLALLDTKGPKVFSDMVIDERSCSEVLALAEQQSARGGIGS